MSYQVIARRWRPQTFDQLVYQDHITQTLKNSIQSGRISHSYLFTGSRGVGKTTTARILAKSLNCVNGPTAEPCGVCENCVEIKAGNSFDVMEIDGASNNGVDNIRDLRETVHFAPVKSNYKIYIIDEVHMLSTGAFNALLKTLEEPPEHTVFIFATTEIHKVPDTILSRCQKFFFKKITPDAIVSHLKTIVEKENSGISEPTLFAIARAATGSMRDAQSLLEQVIAFSGEESGDDAVTSLLGIVPLHSYVRILDAIRENKADVLVNEVRTITQSGTDIIRYVDGFIQTIRALRMEKHGIVIGGDIGYSAEEAGLLKQRSLQFADEEISAMFSVCSELTFKLKNAEHEDIYLEMALLDMTALVSRPSISAIIEKLESAPDTEKKNILKNDTGPRTDPKILSTRQAWQEFLRTLPHQKRYFHEKCSQYVPEFDETSVTLRPKLEEGISLDRNEVHYIQTQLNTLCQKDIHLTIEEVQQEDIPIPETEPGKTESAPEKLKMHPTVSRVIEMFHGQIVTKGDE